MVRRIMDLHRTTIRWTHPQARHGDNMIQVGDLVKSKSSGKVGIVTGVASGYMGKPHYVVLMHDDSYTIYTDNLELLEKK